MEFGFFDFIFLRKRLEQLSRIFDDLNEVTDKIIENADILKKGYDEEADYNYQFLLYKISSLILETSDCITTQETNDIYDDVYRFFNDSIYEKSDTKIEENFEKDIKYVHDKMNEILIKEGAIIMEREDKLLGIDKN